MPRPKKYDTEADRVQAWQAEKIDRVALNMRRDMPVNKAVFQRAAKAMDMSLQEFLVMGGTKYILDNLGTEWLEENQNKGAGEDATKRD